MECITKSLEFAAGASRTLRLLSARKGAKTVVVESWTPGSRPAPHHAQVLYNSNSHRVQFQGQRLLRGCKSPLSWG